jgi:hypothetical protein
VRWAAGDERWAVREDGSYFITCDGRRAMGDGRWAVREDGSYFITRDALRLDAIRD